MLKLAQDPEEISIPGGTPFGCKLNSAAAAYGFRNPNAQFWSQEDGSVLGQLDDAAFLEAGPDPDWEEIGAFVRALGPRVFSCEESAAKTLGFRVTDRGEIMVLHPRGLPQPPFDLEWDVSPREIYGLLERAQTPTNRPPEFEPFYMDLSHRTRHGSAVTACIRRNTLPAACAISTAFTPDAAVVTGVACAPELRRRGLAGSAVLSLAGRLARENIYIFRAEDENEEFYRALGFIPYGRWAEMKF